MSDIVSLIVSLYNLIVRALALALEDAQFQTDWIAFENSLAKLTGDLSGAQSAQSVDSARSGDGDGNSAYVASVLRTESAQAVKGASSASSKIITNPDGSFSLSE